MITVKNGAQEQSKRTYLPKVSYCQSEQDVDRAGSTIAHTMATGDSHSLSQLIKPPFSRGRATQAQLQRRPIVSACACAITAVRSSHGAVSARTRVIVAAVLVVALAACSPTSPATAIVQVGTALTFNVEIADTEQTQREGLTGRSSLPEGTGMLFAFEQRQEQQVWMAGMEIPIDIAWIVDDQVLATDTLDPCTLTDQSQCPRWTSPAPVDMLLEVSAGALNGVEPGDRISGLNPPSDSSHHAPGIREPWTASPLPSKMEPAERA